MRDKTPRFDPERIKGSAQRAANPVLAILIAFMMGGLMVMVSGDDPIQAYGALLQGAFGSWTAIKNTVRYSIPVVLLAYSFSICDRCGYFNISHESQMYSACLAMVIVSETTKGLPSWLRLILMMIAACLASAVACIIPALAKYKLGISEVVVGVMMNYLMAYFTKHMIAFSFVALHGGASIMSKTIPESIGPGLILGSAIVIIAVYQFVLKRTIPGYRLTVVGKNPRFAAASGMPSMRTLLTAAAVGGLLTGICAIGEMLGYYHVIFADFAADMGFNGMTAALIGRGGAIGMMLGSLLLGALRSGSVLLTVVTSVPAEIVDCVQGFVMFFATIELIRPGLLGRKKKRRGEKKAAVAGEAK